MAREAAAASITDRPKAGAETSLTPLTARLPPSDTLQRGPARGETDGGIMTKADEDAIREIELRFNAAWGRHDPDGMVESLVDDAHVVTVNGAWSKTRAQFRDLMQRLHGANGPFRSSTRETPERCMCAFSRRTWQ